MKALVGAFNQEKALVGAFSVIVKTDCETDGSFYSTTRYTRLRARRSASLSHIDPGDLRQFDLDLETELRRLSSKVPPPATISTSDIHIRQGTLRTRKR